MSALQLITDFSVITQHFALNVQTREMELDGQKHALLFSLATHHIALLSYELSTFYENHLVTNTLSWINTIAAYRSFSQLVLAPFMVQFDSDDNNEINMNLLHDSWNHAKIATQAVWNIACRMFELRAINTRDGSIAVNQGLHYKHTTQSMRCIGKFLFQSLIKFNKTLDTACSNYIDPLLQYSPLFFNSAACVIYVASIVFGHTIYGSCGLAIMCIVLLKRHSLLPGWIDQCLNTSLKCTIPIYFSILFVQAGIFKKLLLLPTLVAQYGQLLNRITPFLVNYDLIRHLSTSIQTFLDSLPGSFTPPERKTIPDEYFTWSSEDFITNKDFIYDKTIGMVDPLDATDDQRTNEELFDALRAKIERHQIRTSMSLAEVARLDAGLDVLEDGFVRNKFPSKIPSNVPFFLNILRKIIISLLKDDQNFAANIKALAAAGHNCETGWARDINNLLPRQHSRDIHWSVHNVLARKRSEILQYTINQTFRDSDLIQDASNMFKISAESLTKIIDKYITNAGGSNNVHLIEMIERVCRSWFRSLTAEMSHYRDPPSLVNLLVSNYIHPTLKDLFTLKDNLHTEEQMNAPLLLLHFYSIVYFAEFHALEEPDVMLLVTMAPFLLAMGEGRKKQPPLTSSLTPERLIDTVYDAIKPAYQPVTVETESDTSTSLQEVRDISWEAVLEWMAKTNERLSAEKSENSHECWIEYDKRPDGSTVQYLSRQAVQLLLWDMGILEHADSHTEQTPLFDQAMQTFLEDEALPSFLLHRGGL